MLRVVFLNRAGHNAKGQCARKLSLVKHSESERLLIERRVVASPQRGHDQIRVRGDRAGNVGREIRCTKFGPNLRHHLHARYKFTVCHVEVIKTAATIAVVGMDMRDFRGIGPGHSRPYRASHAVSRSYVGDAEYTFWHRDKTIEQEVAVPANKNR